MAPPPFARPLVEREPVPARQRLVPALSVLAGSALAVLPFVAETPWWPPLGLVVALAWRLLRPELWAAWAALPLGLADDLIGGAPLGSAAATWTIAFLLLDLVDRRMVWRDLGDEWRLAAALLAGAGAGEWLLARLAGGAGPWWTVLPQWLLAVLLFPAAVRLCARLDAWRLRRPGSRR